MVRFAPIIIALATAGLAAACDEGPDYGFPKPITGSTFPKSNGKDNPNPRCTDMGYDYGYKMASGGSEVSCKTMQDASFSSFILTNTDGNFQCDPGALTLGDVDAECSSPEGGQFKKVTLTPSVDSVVFIKGGAGGTLYELTAGVEVTLDVANDGGNGPAISHIEFCFMCDACESTPALPAPTTPATSPTTPASSPTTPAPAPTTPAPAPTTPPPAPDADPTGDTADERAFTRGDPHFKTFGGELYDYHGECDMVLLSNPNFKNGLGMTVHIRTKIQDFWSSVSSAAIKIGDDFLEVAGGEHKEWLWVNGEANEQLAESTWYRASIGGFLVRFKQTGAVREANIYLEGAKEVLVIKTYHDFVRVDINWVDSENYGGSVGLLGAKDNEGIRVGRDGKEISDVNAFGQEWQVKEDEDKLFHNYDPSVVQAPAKCVLPPSMTDEKVALRNRRLAESDLTVEKAEKACEHVQGAAERKACAYDILATQDINMAGAW